MQDLKTWKEQLGQFPIFLYFAEEKHQKSMKNQLNTNISLHKFVSFLIPEYLNTLEMMVVTKE